MSIKALNGALARDGLTTPQFAVLFLLANHADAAGECFPAYPYLMAKTGLSERGVRKTLADLEGLGLVVRVHAKTNAGKPLRVTFLLPFAIEPEPGTTCRPSPAPRAAQPGTTCRPSPAPRAAPSIEEPSSEPSKERGARGAPKVSLCGSQKEGAPGVANGGWSGPPAILHELARRRGQDKAVGWLKRARFVDASATLTHPTGVGVDWLKQALRPDDWAALGVKIIEKAGVG